MCPDQEIEGKNVKKSANIGRSAIAPVSPKHIERHALHIKRLMEVPSFETTKNELGLDHNETRSWHGWHRHVSLVMLAFARMAVIRYRANTLTPLKRLRTRTIRI